MLRGFFSLDFLFNEGVPEHKKERVSIYFLLLVLIIVCFYFLSYVIPIVYKLQERIDGAYTIIGKIESVQHYNDSIANVYNKKWLESMRQDSILKAEYAKKKGIKLF